MAEERSDAMKATNNTLTDPEQDLRRDDRDYPAGPVGERVQADSGGAHAAPTYAGGPGHRLDPDADPAAPVPRHGELAPVGDNARPGGSAGNAPGSGQNRPQAATDLDEGANPTLTGQGAAGADAARVPDSMIADEAASNSVAGGGGAPAGNA
jgi:hypothetical protein